jgi:hypothetical protein
MIYKGGYFEAIKSLRHNAQFGIEGDDYDSLVWVSDKNEIPIPTKSEIELEHNKLKNAWESKNYSRNRANEYPSIGDQLDSLFHAGVYPKEMADKIQAIKNNNPKP